MITILVHASMTKFVLYFISKTEAAKNRFLKFKDFWLALTVLIIFSASLIETLIWAVCYFELKAIKTFEDALYFSLVTFTTLGYGDITLSVDWQLLSSLQAANGILLFGWSTAIIVAIVQKYYIKK